MTTVSAMQHLSQRALYAEEILTNLKQQLEEVKRTEMKNIMNKEEKRIRRENERLKREVDEYKKKLILAEIAHGIKQVPLPNKRNLDQITSDQRVSPTKEIEVNNVKAAPKPVATINPDNKTSDVDVSKLNIRVGFVKSAKKHPDADTMYVIETDMGEEKPRNVLSGLVGSLALSEIEGRMCVFLCNLKPAKLRGILSEGMILEANGGDKVELLKPPPGSVPGDRVVCAKYPGEPERVINSKNKIWDLVKPHMKTDNDCVATYKGEPLIIVDKGQVTVPSLANKQLR
ncbi:aminoacyl tRNA synthase complex-interacting multifunctional protein 1-like [Octopus bimaculoides]|uniref:tRNA-binding domain-containing protein n=1 Tax=Octopus bimaculoides TaxID=37653 RepID=A0A0L8GGW0_OCTBM|nr:aminoacyl tRNA synthase complex-interacting multifunctional protein 1-like [Octopus bimaculoides]